MTFEDISLMVSSENVLLLSHWEWSVRKTYPQRRKNCFRFH
ncbi:hypothetical Protein YC6258_02517 [Gynuella sunshinyii YC6258]|uniref:Uncharacterized protein n=1 Tax=Gynuella sunshinyii YC6258 TaxID=1445510 RepID=A0A0C5V502_9GAMM|nr:hypothetical Protein YC6258_02517 [Gynuella sunshinyii YC6258]